MAEQPKSGSDPKVIGGMVFPTREPPAGDINQKDAVGERDINQKDAVGERDINQKDAAGERDIN